jgi:hypothetical protein
MALIVAGTLAPESYCADFRAARIAAMIPITRLRFSSISAAPDRTSLNLTQFLRSETTKILDTPMKIGSEIELHKVERGV